MGYKQLYNPTPATRLVKMMRLLNDLTSDNAGLDLLRVGVFSLRLFARMIFLLGVKRRVG
jgi:hypothetical protein